MRCYPFCWRCLIHALNEVTLVLQCENPSQKGKAEAFFVAAALLLYTCALRQSPVLILILYNHVLPQAGIIMAGRKKYIQNG